MRIVRLNTPLRCPSSLPSSSLLVHHIQRDQSAAAFTREVDSSAIRSCQRQLDHK